MALDSELDWSLDAAARAIADADALLIGAGAGMGVDSGMPDFRGDDGFWKAYPAFRGRQFSEMSNPVWFRRDPEQAWGFFGHRFRMYRDTPPHAGYGILRRIAARMPAGAAVFTSNVDGHFQKASFDPHWLVECHGSIHHLQCSENCTSAIWPACGLRVEVDPETVRAVSPLPTCGACGAVARPNILMFDDFLWLADRRDRQHQRYLQWRRSLDADRLVVVELGAGTAIPTVRGECQAAGGKLIRINPRDPQARPRDVSLPLAALEALEQIQQRLASLS